MPDARPIRLVRDRLTRWRRRGDVGPGVVVAVSGGGDSVALLRILNVLAPELGLGLSVAHIDHGVRGEAARSDARFVAALAESLGLSFDLGHWGPSRTAHFESDARRARYAWLEQVARQRGASVVAVGHTLDDQAETILHRIVRGTGPRGLAGIPARRALSADVLLIRPLLDVSRAELRTFLASLGQTFRDDDSNDDTQRTRARVRHDLLPKLATEYNPRVALSLVRLGRLAAQSEQALRDRVIELEHAATVHADEREIRFDRAALARAPRYLRSEVLRSSWRRAGWPEMAMSERRWRRLTDLARRGTGRVSIGGHVDAIASTSTLRLVRIE